MSCCRGYSQSVVPSGQMGRSEPGCGGRRTQEEKREEMHLPPLLQRTAVVKKQLLSFHFVELETKVKDDRLFVLEQQSITCMLQWESRQTTSQHFVLRVEFWVKLLRSWSRTSLWAQ